MEGETPASRLGHSAKRSSAIDDIPDSMHSHRVSTEPFERPGWDTYFMEVANTIAKRKSINAVL